MTGFQLLPPLTVEEYAALRDDIKAHGVLATIDVDENGVILDGHHRQQIATELGIPCPRRVVKGLHGDPSKRTYALTVNTNRRHLTAEQRRHLTETSLREDPQLTDREHGRRIGVHHTTVGTARERLQASGQLARTETRTDSRGHQHKAPMPKAAEPSGELATSDDGSANDAEVLSAMADTDDGLPATHPDGDDDGRESNDVPPSEIADTDDPMQSDPLPLPGIADAVSAIKSKLSDKPEIIDEAEAHRSSGQFAAGLAGLWMILDPNPVDWIEKRYRPDAYRDRTLPRVREVFTVDGLRTLADHLNDIADHLESKGVTL